MSIIDSFDKDSKPLIAVEDCYAKNERRLRACIINFSRKIMDALTEDGLITPIEGGCMRSVPHNYPVFLIAGTDIGVVKTTVGAPITSTLLEEIGYIFSCDKFIMFGSCGGLDKSISPGKLIVPTHAYRDEGVSYHYAPPADYIGIPNHVKVGEVLDRLEVPYVKGRTWTTDAFYRETVSQFNARKSEGCIAVEMEVSACQAVADWLGYEFYNFLYRADNLDSGKWDQGVLASMPTDERLKHFYIALELARSVI